MSTLYVALYCLTVHRHYFVRNHSSLLLTLIVKLHQKIWVPRNWHHLHFRLPHTKVPWKLNLNSLRERQNSCTIIISMIISLLNASARWRIRALSPNVCPNATCPFALPVSMAKQPNTHSATNHPIKPLQRLSPPLQALLFRSMCLHLQHLGSSLK
jgi:hypothetical protein